MGVFSGSRPVGLGEKYGVLKAPPATPNAVSSQATGGYHKVAPLAYKGTLEQAMKALKAIVENMPRTQIVEIKNDYLYAEFSSAVFGFVDDVEFYFPQDANVIDVRSASRLGYSDLGVNRKRIETIRARLEQSGA